MPIVDVTSETLVHTQRFFDAVSLTQADRLDDGRDHEHVRLVVFNLARMRTEESADEWNESKPWIPVFPSPLGARANSSQGNRLA